MNASIKLQRNIALLAFVLLAIKLLAWYWTGSVAVYTDALESIVNVVSGLFGWYSLWLAAKPKDLNHPYGHGKVEFISSAIEGMLIIIAGIAIIYEAIQHWFEPRVIQKLDYGLLLLLATGLINYAVGTYALRKGKRKMSATLQAAGSHLRTDTYSTLGIVLGLFLLKITGWQWLDIAVAVVFAIIILATGYRIMRRSLAGIMDEADIKLLQELIDYLNKHRRPSWIDLHNLRIIQYGHVLHLDGHLTLPWYFTVREAHEEIEALNQLIQDKFGTAVEMFVHVDGCEPYSCPFCCKMDCEVRQHPYQHQLPWTTENVLLNKKHGQEHQPAK